MKTNSTFKHILLAFSIALSVVACKKDKTDPEPAPPAEVKAITLTELKALSTGASVKVPDAKKITGIVISDATGKNIDSKSIVLQEAGNQTGIIISFDAAPTFAVGDQVEVNISNQTLAQVDGEVMLQNIPAANAKKTGTGTITAKATTIAEITANKTAWDGTLITLAATDLTGGNGKYTGTLTIKDASGTITSNVLAGAAFENIAYPVSVSSITGIIRTTGAETRIDVRNAADAVVGTITSIVTDNLDNILALVTGQDDFDSYNNYGFGTDISYWNGQGSYNTITGKDFPEDAGYAKAGKTYTYIKATPAAGSSYNMGYGGPKTKTPGLKTVTVTFAVTKASSFVYGYFGSTPLDPSVTAVQIAVQPKILTPAGNGNIDEIILNDFTGNDKLIAQSPVYTSAGQFYTFTWTLPTRADLAAAGVSETDITSFLANPGFTFYNLSKSATSKNLMFFEKVVFGYGN